MMFAQTALENYGPIGIMASIAIGALGWLYKDKVARERELDARHLEERKCWSQECKAERSEIMALHAKAWEESRADTKAVMAENIKAVNALEKAVIDLHIDVKARRMKEEQG